MDKGYDKDRIEKLRLVPQSCSYDYSELKYHFFKSLKDRNRDKAYALRVGEAIYDIFDNTAPYIGSDELIVGRMAGREFTKDEQEEYKLLEEYAIQVTPAMRGQASHMTIDYDLLLNKGIEGIVADIAKKRERLDLTLPGDIEKDNFYMACIRSLEGVMRFAERYAEEACAQAKSCGCEKRRQELLLIAKNLRKAPRYPASSFYEAIQAAHFITFCISARPFVPGSHLYQLGRPDRYLWQFYKHDVENGIITPYFAQTLIDCYAILLETRIPSGLASGYMVGGREKDGRVVSNDLTRMGMEAVRHVRLIYPGVGLCWCRDTPEEDLRLACEILGEGHSHPAIFNDDVISKGLEFHGLPKDESHDYIHSTCVEITPIASSNVWVASPYMNLVQKLLEVMEKDYPSLEMLLDAYFAHVESGIVENLINETRLRADRARYMMDPLLSCFVNDCLEKGVDIEQGGARYNWIMPSFVGLSNVADALCVLEKLVYGSGELPMDTLRAALKNDYDGYEIVRQRILNAVPKYGNDNDEADKYVISLTQWLTDIMSKYQKRKENYLVPSLFCWIMHDQFGQKTGASPDGRKAGFPLGDGSGPAQGRELRGPTAAVLSSTKWDHHKFIGGVAVNMKFSKKMFNEASVEKLIAIIKTYLDRGGFELQVNVVDRETLLKAKENPDAYRDVIVRVGGYSDYFVKLSPTMQEEVLARTEYQI
ncbi:MAG: hypothetical protein FWH01_05855 [Oscillospiraceae bacterium]|nr:hypothetical protein [Oscillospiraceae bacterium]